MSCMAGMPIWNSSTNKPESEIYADSGLFSLAEGQQNDERAFLLP